MLEGRRVSAITIQKILNDHDLGTRYDRWLRWRPARPSPRELSAEQVAFIEKLNGSVLGEFFRVKMREAFNANVEALQTDLDARLVDYNSERPHLGYPNMGRRP